MNDNPQSYNLEEILAGYVLGDLDEVELVWLNEQLAKNPQLKEQVAQLELSLNLIPYGLPEDTPKNDLRSQILAQSQPKLRFPKYRLSWMIATVTAVSTLLLGINNLNLRQQIAINQEHLEQQQELITELRQSNHQLVALRANDNSITASGNLFLSPQSNTAVLALKNLDSLPGKQVYRLWAVYQGKKTGCSNFKPNAQGEVYLDLSSDDAIFKANSILITVEPKADTEQPLGRELLSGSFSEI